MTSAAIPYPAAGKSSTPRTTGVVSGRIRWRMSMEAKLLLVFTAALLAFGLATLYSASAGVAMQAGRPSWHFLVKQLTGVGLGVVAFAIAAKMDA
jgi:cell division protein FtsW